MSESDKKSAEVKALYLLNQFRMQFPGLDGKIAIREVKTIENHAQFYEIILPEKPYDKKITLLEKIWSVFSFLTIKTEDVVSFYFQWQQDDSIPLPTDGTKDVKLKIYFTISSRPTSPSTSTSGSTTSKYLQQYLSYVLSDIKNTKDEHARIIPTPNNVYKRIVEEETFVKNLVNRHTGARYSALKSDNWMPELIPNFIDPEEIDFTLSRDIPIQKAVGLTNENANLKSSSIGPDGTNKIIGTNGTKGTKGTKLYIGDYIDRHGTQTQLPMYIRLDDLIRHMYINGLTRSGKSYLLASLLHQLYASNAPIGVLVILLRKGNEKTMFRADQYLEYPNFKVPYFFSNELFEQLKSLDAQTHGQHGVSKKDAIDTVTLMTTSSIGLKDIFYTNCCNAFTNYVERHKEAPKKFSELGYHFKQWFQDKKYQGDFGTNAILAIENRFYKVRDDDFEHVVELAHQLPDWFVGFLNGQKIVLDFTSCSANNYKIKLLLNFLFHMIKLFIPQSTTNTLKYLVCIDEAEFIAKKYHSYDPYDNEVIAQSQIKNIIEEIIESFGSRGLGLVLTGKDAKDLFDCIRRSGIVFLFTTDIQTAAFFVDREDQLTISKLPPRVICCINRNTNELYLARTADFDPQPQNHNNHQRIS